MEGAAINNNGSSTAPTAVGSEQSSTEAPPMAEDPQKVVAQEEEKLKSRFPTAVRPGGSLFLQKKLLQRGQKYFDSGDYNMARGQGAKMGPIPKLHGKTITGEKLAVPNVPTGISHPSPDVIPNRKTSITTSKLASGSSPPVAPVGFSAGVAGAPIPPPSYD